MGGDDDTSNDVATKFPNTNVAQKSSEIVNTKNSIATRKKSKPIAGFVSTSILTSSDGLFGDHIEEERIEGVADSKASDSRTLYERLQEQKDEKDAEWKAAHNPFAPPKGLDDEELEFLHNVDEAHKKRDRELKAQHDADLASFTLARESKTEEVNDEPKQPKLKKMKPTTTTAAAFIVKKKTKKKSIKTPKQVIPPQKKGTTTNNAVVSLSSLVAYDESSSSSDSSEG